MSRLAAWLHRESARITCAIAVLVIVLGLSCTAFIAGGADSYGYLAEARLWREGTLVIDQPFMADVPWTNPRWSFTPLGFRPVSDGWAIVPVHAPGYPLLIAGAQTLFGYCAGAGIVPICGAMLIATTYLLGRRLGRPLVGLAAAMLVAVSPTALFMLVNPMSDLPAAAFWSLALVLILGESRASALAAGLAAGIAILIRPNIVPLAGVFGVYALRRDLIAAPRWRVLQWRALWFTAGAGAGIGAEMAINAHLYGSPFLSGYRDLDYALSHMRGNLTAYAGWLMETESPAVFAGLVSLVLPLSALWTTDAARRPRWFFLAVFAAVWIPTLCYSEFNAWWYLRYVLATWPIIAFATASCLAAIYRRGGTAIKAGVIAVFAMICAHNAWDAWTRGLLDFGRGERKYLTAAEMVRAVTPPESVILSMQHSGSLRYYGGRMTLRWDQLKPGELDMTVTWLLDHGHHPYLLAEGGEEQQLKSQYGPSDSFARLEWNPLVVIDALSRIKLYDAARWRTPAEAAPAHLTIPAVIRHCDPPVEPPQFARR